MRRSRFSEEQIISVLEEHEAGMKTAELCRKHGISDATLYKWKAKYGGMTASETARLRTLEDENRRLAILLRREGMRMNLKKVYRLYREERLVVRRRGGRKRALGAWQHRDRCRPGAVPTASSATPRATRTRYPTVCSSTSTCPRWPRQTSG